MVQRTRAFLIVQHTNRSKNASLRCDILLVQCEIKSYKLKCNVERLKLRAQRKECVNIRMNELKTAKQKGEKPEMIESMQTICVSIDTNL